MIYRGIVRNGVVELEEGRQLPDGTRVNVEPTAREAEAPPLIGELGWPANYFESTFGSIDDETFVRPPQGKLPDASDVA